MIEQIVENIKWICDKNNVQVPNIFTEFGSYTVGESGGNPLFGRRSKAAERQENLVHD